MRYLFRGMIRTNGRVVEGHVEAPTPEQAYAALSDNGIVTESLRPDPRPDPMPAAETEADEDQAPAPYRDAIDSALDSASHQVNFDSLTEQYRGKKVWVLDRDKIRRRVAQVVDQVLSEAQQKNQSDSKTRELVAEAIKGMFNDNRNIASERSAESVAAERAMMAAEKAAAAERAANIAAEKAASVAAERMAAIAAAAVPQAPAGKGKPLPASAALEAQIARLAEVVLKAESALGAIVAASRRVGRGGGGGGGGRRTASGPVQNEQNEVLLEIFKTNLALQHAVEGGEVLDMTEEGTVTELTPGAEAGGNGAAAGEGTGGAADAGNAGEDGNGATPGDRAR